MLDPYRFGELGSANTGWNPADKASGVTLSNSNKTMRGGSSGFPGARAVSSRSAGILYFEITTDSAFQTADITDVYAGVVDSVFALDVQPVFGATGGKWVVTRFNSQFNSDSGTTTGSGANVATNGGHTVGFKVDFSTRIVSMYMDGTAVGTGTYSSGGGAMFPFGETLTSGGTSDLTLRTTAAEFVQSIPGGASAWDA